jgi:hypothetical protein
MKEATLRTPSKQTSEYLAVFQPWGYLQVALPHEESSSRL